MPVGGGVATGWLALFGVGGGVVGVGVTVGAGVVVAGSGVANVGDVGTGDVLAVVFGVLLWLKASTIAKTTNIDINKLTILEIFNLRDRPFHFLRSVRLLIRIVTP